MNRLLLFLAALSITAASAELVIVEHSRVAGGMYTNNSGLDRIDLGIAENAIAWQRNAMPPVVDYPSLVNPKLRLVVPLTGSVQSARARLSAIDDARRPARAELQAFLGELTPRQFRQGLKAAYRNAGTNTAFNAAQRGIISNLLVALKAEDDFADLRDAKRAEDQALGLVNGDEP